MRQHLILFFVHAATIAAVVSEDDELLQINKLRKRLLVEQSYQRNARPVRRHATVTNVSLTVFIRKIVSLDVSTASLTTYATLNMEWMDEHLIWDPSQYGGVDQMNFAFYEIWTPDIRCWSVVDGPDMSRSIGRDPLRVTKDGTVSWWTRTVIRSECSVDLTDFPFDQQSCSIYLGSWTYDSTHLNLTSNSKFSKQVYGPFTRNPEWAVVGKDVFPSDLNASEVAAWHSLGIELQLLRRNNKYKYRIGVPYFTAWAFALFSFLSDMGSNRRFLFSAIALAIHLTLIVQLAHQLGPHSVHTPYAFRCLAMSMAVVTTSLIVSAVVNAISHTMTKANVILPHMVTAFLDAAIVRAVLCLREKQVTASTAGDSRLLDARSSELIGRDWQLMRQFVDRLSLFSFIVTALVYHS